MARQLTNIRYFDLEGCCEILFPSAYCIISSLPHLMNIDFVPGNALVELYEWKRLYNIFFRVSFGISFKRILPHQGAYVRLPEHFEEIEE